MVRHHKGVRRDRQAGRQDGSLHPERVDARQKQEKRRHQNRMDDQPRHCDRRQFAKGAADRLAIDRGPQREEGHRRRRVRQHVQQRVEHGRQGQSAGRKGKACHRRDQQGIAADRLQCADDRRAERAAVRRHEIACEDQQHHGVECKDQRQRKRRRVAKGHDRQWHADIAIVRIGRVQSEDAAFETGQAKGRARQKGGADKHKRRRQLIPPDKSPVEDFHGVAGADLDENHHRHGDEKGEARQGARVVRSDETHPPADHSKEDQGEKGNGQGQDGRHTEPVFDRNAR